METERDRLIKKIEQEKLTDTKLGELLDTLFQLSQGVWYEKVGLDGSVRVYKTVPDKAAGEYLVDRTLGRIPNKTELTGKDGKDFIPRADVEAALANIGK
jgi:hypothetical protein